MAGLFLFEFAKAHGGSLPLRSPRSFTVVVQPVLKVGKVSTISGLRHFTVGIEGGEGVDELLIYKALHSWVLCASSRLVLKGNWNYYDALRSEKRGPKLEATHLEKQMNSTQRYCWCISTLCFISLIWSELI
ncbi:hypothetical protein Scep_020027 [Stephania cephalantha]|uniref:Uncharacterized protein n=1 Tax=Stephania cephalantha TaxID=152367 RepID=A0AAP0NMR8_9MAGN